MATLEIEPPAPGSVNRRSDPVELQGHVIAAP